MAPFWLHFPTMARLLSHPPVRAFLAPLDVSTPMTRVDFWTFYAGYCALLVPCLLVFDFLLAVGMTQAGNPVSFIAPLLTLAGLVWLMMVLFCSMARRLADSGFRRLSVPLFLLLAASAFGLLVSAAAAAWQPGLPADLQPAPDIHPAARWLTGLALACSLYIFYGLIRPSRQRRAEDDTSCHPGSC